ncbi:MAG: ATP-binding protein [Candidatus Poribacteria bacterium]|nr:ATP-binding protein [Candidatus Poribacteria bacterium]
MPFPTFWKTIEERHKAKLSHQFLLYFNINDMIYDDIYGYLYTRDYLLERMNYLGCDSVLYYTRSEGLLFTKIELRNA